MWSACLSAANQLDLCTCFRTLQNMHCFCCHSLCSHHVTVSIGSVDPGVPCTDGSGLSQCGAVLWIAAFRHCVCDPRIRPMLGSVRSDIVLYRVSWDGPSTTRSACLSSKNESKCSLGQHRTWGAPRSMQHVALRGPLHWIYRKIE